MTLPSHKSVLLTTALCLVAALLWAQTPYPGCPNVDGIPDDPSLPYSGDTVTLACGQTCLDLTASALETGTTSNYKVESVPYAPPFSFSGGTPLFVGSDDIFSGIINLPFDFCFYNNTFNRLVVGANGCISFNTGYAGANCCYSHDEPIPTPNDPTCPLGVGGPGGLYRNTVNGAFHDLDPSVGNPDINYSVLGSPPCRTFVVNFRNVPHFDCNNLRTTQQIVLYETTNVVEVYIQDKPRCNSWNGGRATIGIQNGAGTQGIAPPGRNTGAWTANNEGWRFTPNGAPNYSISWFNENGSDIGSGSGVNFCLSDATTPEKVYVQINYTICNGNNIVVTDSVVIAPRPPVVLSASATEALCADSCNGTGTVTISSGTAPYTITWPFGEGEATEDSLCAGNYNVQVEDAEGCISDISLTVNEPSKISLSLDATEASCNGSSDGTATATASGGTGNLTYSWTSDESTPSITGPAGNYIVTVTDENGCSTTEGITIEEPDALVLDTISTRDLSCAENEDGEIIVQASGGNSPYEFSINGSAFSGTSSFTNLAAGTYTIRLRDDNGCIDEKTYELTADSVRVVAPNDTTICQGESLKLVAEGYFTSATWNNGVIDNFSFTPNHMGSLNYIVVAENAQGCTDTDTTVITVAYVPDPTITPAGPYCDNSQNDTLETAEPNGTWSGTGINAEGIFSPASAGQGDHKIKYSFGGFCPRADSVILSVNSQFDAAINDPGVICELDEPFDLTSTTQGGTWTGPGINNPNFPTFSPADAGPGTHRIYHLIDNECGDFDSLDITVVGATFADIDTLIPLCAQGSLKSLSVSPTTPGSWSGSAPVQSGGNFDPVGYPPGSYPVIFTPDGTCIIRDTAIQVILDTLIAYRDTDSLFCKGDQNGSLTTVYTGGSGQGYTFTWSPGGNLGPSANNLGEGVYDVTVTDHLGCNTTVQHEVFAPPGMGFTQAPEVTNPSCGGYTDGAIKVFIDGGSKFNSGPEYIYSIVPNAGVLADSGFVNLGTGKYVVTATDDKGCTLSTDTVTLSAPAPIAISSTVNPANCGRPNGSVIINTAGGGSNPFLFYWDGTLTPDTHLINAVPGSYDLQIVDAQGCILDSTYSVPNTGAPDINITSTDALCNDSLNGTASAVASNGISPYNYDWDNGMTGANISGLGAGDYILTVTDAVNCSSKDTVTINEPSSVVVDALNDTLLCFGQVLVQPLAATGGNGGPYDFMVNGAMLASDTMSVDSVATINVTAFDASGCPSDPESFDVYYRNPITSNINTPDSICRGDDATVLVTANGGLGTYSYTWSNGSTDISTTFETSTSDTILWVYVDVSDGCSLVREDSARIPFYPRPQFQPNISPNKGCEPLDVDVILPSHNYQNITWYMGNGQVFNALNDFNVQYQEFGDYLIRAVITNEHGCVSDHPLDSIEVYPIPFGEFRQRPAQLTSLNNNGLFTLENIGPLSQAIWNLQMGDDTLRQQITASDEFFHRFVQDSSEFVLSAEVTSIYGCENTLYYAFNIIPEHTIYVPNTFTPNNDGVNDNFSLSWQHINPERFEIIIFNRWGEEVYRSSDPNFIWDGEYEGSLVQPGLYPYRIDFYTEATRQKKIFGHLNILH